MKKLFCCRFVALLFLFALILSAATVWGEEYKLKTSVDLKTETTEDSDAQYIIKGFIVDLISSMNDSSDSLRLSMNENPDKGEPDITISTGFYSKKSGFFSDRPKIIILKSKNSLPGEPDKEENTLYFVINRDDPGLEAILTEAVETIDKSGIYSEIFTRWKAVYQQSSGSRSSRKLLLTVLIMIVILSAVLIIWSRILGRKVDNQQDHREQ